MKMAELFPLNVYPSTLMSYLFHSETGNHYCHKYMVKKVKVSHFTKKGVNHTSKERRYFAKGGNLITSSAPDKKG